MSSHIPLRLHEHLMRQMVQEIHQGTLTLAQAAAKFAVNRTTVRHWLARLEAADDLLAAPEPPMPLPAVRMACAGPAESAESEQIQALQRRIQSLERDLETATFKALYQATLLKLAEEELGLDIEKKSVTKPSDAC